MRPRLLALAAVALPIGGLFGTAFDVRPSRDEVEVRTVVQAYFDGMMEGNPYLLRQAFHPEAFLIGPGGEEGVLRIPFADWSARMSHPLSDPDQRRNRILSVDITGNAAVAKTELLWPGIRYVDYLSLLRVEGEWQIVNKIWHEEAPARG